MKSHTTKLFVCLSLMVCCDVVAGQGMPAIPESKDDKTSESSKARKEREKSAKARRKTASNITELEGSLPSSREVQDLVIVLLDPTTTWLTRQLPREIYKPDPANSNGTGALFSFFHWPYPVYTATGNTFKSTGLFADLYGAQYGIMFNLGDVPLEQVSLADPRTLFLSEYQPPQDEDDILTEFVKLFDGLGFRQMSTMRTDVNATFVARSICYDWSDALLAFRVVRKDQRVMFTWKLLKTYPTPKFIRAK